MAEFTIAFENTLKFEDAGLSGVVTVDGGGRTRFGIAEKFHPGLPDDFFTGSKEAALREAEVIEERDYWSAMRLADIDSQAVANKLFDMAVNMGVRQAAVIAQRAANGEIAVIAEIARNGAESGKSRESPIPPTFRRMTRNSGACWGPRSSSSTGIGSSDDRIMGPAELHAQVGGPLIEDGVIGGKTLAAINAIDPDRYLQVLRELCAEFYRHVASLHPEDAVDLKGWLKRAEA